jgi:hypothetical protein
VAIKGIVITGLFGLAGAVIAGMWGYAAATNNAETEEPSAPPGIVGMEVEWTPNTEGEVEGRYQLTGEVENFEPGQLVWSYNQPLNPDTNGDGVRDGVAGPIYPDHGPCTVDSAGKFTCDLGWAGEPVSDAGQPFGIWAAVVDDEDAHAAAAIKSDLFGRPPYANRDAVPHINGDRTMVMTREVRPTRDAD